MAAKNQTQRRKKPDTAPRLGGYARLSTDEPNVTLQLEALQHHGCRREWIFVDTALRARTQRPGLEVCLDSLGAGGVLLVWRLDRLGRSMPHLVNLVTALHERGIGFRSICDGLIDTTTASRGKAERENAPDNGEDLSEGGQLWPQRKMVRQEGLSMKKWTLGIMLVLLVAVVIIQFIPVDRSNPPVEAEIPAPPEVKTVLRAACYDCHSNETTWPWYSSIAPISWLVARDVHAGREELSFSTWNRYSTKQQVDKLKESLEEINEGDMPPWFYLAVHRDIQLSTRDRAALQSWARGSTAPDGSTPSPQQRPEPRD